MLKNLLIKRYNIYSGMDIKYGNISICVDPAKIVPQELDKLNPDLILVSHESMDHMDPIQIYQLQKRKNCKIFCNIAAAVDLIQYFPQDIEFIDSINTMLPNSTIYYKNLKITAILSKHCDYMLPVIFRLDFLESGYSILHCIDTLIYDDLDAAAKDVNLCIIPIGIAKGVDAQLGMQFIEKLKSPTYLVNHFTNQNKEFKTLVAGSQNLKQKNIKIFFTDWNESCEIPVNSVKKSNITVHENKFSKISCSEICELLNSSENLKNDLIALLAELNTRKSEIMKESLILCLGKLYKGTSRECKSLILIILSVLSLYDGYLVGKNKNFIDLLLTDLKEPVNTSNEELKSSILFFLGVFSQQSAQICQSHLESLVLNAGISNEHVTYWVVECLGRMCASESTYSDDAVEALLEIVKQPELFNSVIVRRRIFWEFCRLIRRKPSLGSVFIEYFVDGLEDTNPDVRLLAELCIGISSRACDILNEDIMEKFIKLSEDEEDDVREIFVRCWIIINRYHPAIGNKYKDKVKNLLRDPNCHVKLAATEAFEKE